MPSIQTSGKADYKCGTKELIKKNYHIGLNIYVSR